MENILFRLEIDGIYTLEVDTCKTDNEDGDRDMKYVRISIQRGNRYSTYSLSYEQLTSLIWFLDRCKDDIIVFDGSNKSKKIDKSNLDK